MSEFIKRFILLLFLTRPVVLIPVWGFSLFGFRLASDDTNLFNWLHRGSFLIMLIFSLSVAAVYLINQIEDFDVDADNGGFPLLVKSGISKTAVRNFAILLGIISIGAPLLVHHTSISILSGISLFIGILYSCKPTYFTGRPLFDFLSNGLGYGLVAFAAGWILAKGEISHELYTSAAPYIFLMFAGSISSTLPDIEGDRAHNKRTTAVVFGTRPAHILSILLLITGTVWGKLNGDPAAFISGMISIPIYFLYLINPTQAIMEATYKVGGGFMMLIIALYYPLFALFASLVGVITLLYFRIVHQVSYPSLKPVEK